MEAKANRERLKARRRGGILTKLFGRKGRLIKERKRWLTKIEQRGTIIKPL